MTDPSIAGDIERSDVSSQGLRLATYFLRADREVARVILTHGMGEHAGRYPHVMRHLAAHGISCAAYDLRGHGRSDGNRGALRHYRDFLDDLDAVLHQFDCPGVSTFLYGHSMGGQITINYISDRHPPIAGTILASPWLELAFRPPIWRLALAALAARILPGFTQNAPSREENLSRDLEWLASLKNDASLSHRRVSAGMFLALKRGATRARAAASHFQVPFLLMHGESDTVTCKTASRAFFTAAPVTDKHLKFWPDMRHETHNEIGREQVLATVSSWILDRAHPTER